MKRTGIFALLLTMLIAVQLAPRAMAAENVTVYMSIEKFTLGQGFYLEPTAVETAAGTSAAELTTRLLKEKWQGVISQPWQSTGSVESAFYLSALYDPQRGAIKVPEFLRSYIETEEDNTPDWLGEFDYTSTSGWIYSVNDVLPDVSASDYKLKDGDVIRWQLTLYGYGADICSRNTEWGEASIVSQGDKTELLRELARVNKAYSSGLCQKNKAYGRAHEVTCDIEASQGEIDSAASTLKANGPRFDDVSEKAWYRADVDAAVKKGLFQGTSDTCFSPENTLSRAMAATVLYRVAGSPEVSGVAFADVKETDWYYDAASWAYANGIMNDFASDNMRPNQSITRMELAAMLYRQSGTKGSDVSALSAFADGGAVPKKFAEALAWCVRENIFQGDDTNKLNAEAKLTRAQFAAITGRI